MMRLITNRRAASLKGELKMRLALMKLHSPLSGDLWIEAESSRVSWLVAIGVLLSLSQTWWSRE